MKYHTWSPDKNEWLKTNRKLSFESVVLALEAQDLLDIIDHPNTIKYPDQKIYVILLNDYVHLVPFIEDESTVFLKTIIPNRQANAQYARKNTS
jgi:hypothetical protein